MAIEKGVAGKAGKPKPSMSELEERVKYVELQAREVEAKLPALNKAMQLALLPKDAADEKNAIMEIRARTTEEAGGLITHEAEELAYVLDGTIEIHTEDYRPTRLEAGDCMYMDSTSGHVYVNAGKAEVARVLAVTTHAFVDPRHA